MARWKKQTLKLKPDHTWRAPSGYKICVLDRGAIRFNVPDKWIVTPDPDAIRFHDRQPPDDNCVLAVSFLRLPPVDWSGLPLSQFIPVALEGDKREIIAKGEIVEVRRGDLELAWIEIRFMDENERREAIGRLCVGRGANIQSLITFDFWPEDAARLEPVWDEVLRSLELGAYIKDPTHGKVVH